MLRTVALILTLAATGISAQPKAVTQASANVGEMYGSMEALGGKSGVDSLRFEPFQMIDEMFVRNDVVWLMRHGPTDWSKLDRKGVISTDCDNQRVMSADGLRAMQELGQILAYNEVLPGKIITSEWCRNRQTVAAMLSGVADTNPAYSVDVPVETMAGSNLLLSLGGAATTKPLEEMVSNWTGEGFDRPLLIVSHYTNIEELTDFRVYEGEVLVLDPKRDNRVIGYFRLKSAAPDVGHFAEEVVKRTNGSTVTN